MYRKLTFLFITLVMVSLVITPVGKAIAQVETQVSVPDCPPFDPALSQDQKFPKSLPPECFKADQTLTQNFGSQASAQDVLPVASNAGSIYKSELNGLAAPYTLYLPLVVNSRGINGQITYQGNPVSGVLVWLYRNNGNSTWSTISSTYTNASGYYEFMSAPSLGSGQFYSVESNLTDAAYVDYCYKNLRSYTAGSIAAGGNFEIANIPQVSPVSGANVGFPTTFQWTPRVGMSTDNYSVDIWVGNNGWSSPNLGYVSQYTLTSLPTGLSLGTQYYWDVSNTGSDGSICWSYDQHRAITFH